jgi:predicted nuclease of predicted toxin-antitoxin system
MSRPRFLFDHDFKDPVIRGILRRQPLLEVNRVRELGLATAADDIILDTASRAGLLTISHDVNTMSAAAFDRLNSGKPMNGLILVKQSLPIGLAIHDLLLIWDSSEAEEWNGVVQYLPL